ncbi:MAG: restriction endonuclease subunit R [Cloacibacterium sp.]|nr:restriction endonuclease subunit R [Cloacibacterium sp.]
MIQTIKRFYEDKKQDYLIIVATPFVSLVEQYVNDIHTDGKIPKNQIYNYNKIGRSRESYTDKKVHVITANTLLGNPGEDSYKNSDKKRKYLNDLIADCENKGRKVIFIFDEIHDTIQNFKEEYLFNLWKWKNVAHKNFIISATFTEASFVVIEYLAELTDKKIYVVEFPRLRIRENQSKLFLYYSSSHKFLSTTYEIRNTIENLLARGKDLDILCYSKTLAKSIISDKVIGKKLKEKFGKINDCTSENADNQRPFNEPAENIFDNNMCNIGTNFKSGVSIEKENHAFVIIMPPKGAKMPFKNNYGIFSSGINSIIQALARQRKKGEIHIILPKPKEFDYDTLIFEEEEQHEQFKEFYERVKDSSEVEEKTKYIPLAEQDNMFFNFYENTLKANIKDEIAFVKNLERPNKVRLDFPEYKLYKLSDSEDYFVNKTLFFGGDLSAYITYCAVTNQFINCKFVGGFAKQELILNYGEIQKGLKEFCDKVYFFDDDRMSLYYFLNDAYFYKQFRDDLFEMCEVKLKTSEGKVVNLLKDGTSTSSKYFEGQLLGFVQHFGYPNNPLNRIKFKKEGELVDGSYDRSQFLLEAISHSQNLNVENFNTNESEKERIKIFKFLGNFRQKIIDSIQIYSTRNESDIQYIKNKPSENFISEHELPEFRRLVQFLLNEDDFFKKFSFKERLANKSESQQIEVVYSILSNELFILEKGKLPTGTRENVKKVKFIKPLPEHSQVVNYVLPPDYDFPDGYEPIELTDEQIESIKRFTRNN